MKREFLIIDKVPRRQMETLRLRCEGLTNKEVADRMGVSVHTVKNQMNRLMTNLFGLRHERSWVSVDKVCYILGRYDGENEFASVREFDTITLTRLLEILRDHGVIVRDA